MQNNKPAGWGQQSGQTPQGWGTPNGITSPWEKPPEPPKPEVPKEPPKPEPSKEPPKPEVPKEPPKPELSKEPPKPEPSKEPPKSTPPKQPAPEKGKGAVFVVLALLLVALVVLMIVVVTRQTVKEAEPSSAATEANETLASDAPTASTEIKPTETMPTESNTPSPSDLTLISCVRYGEALMEMTKEYDWQPEYAGFDYSCYVPGIYEHTGVNATDDMLVFYLLDNRINFCGTYLEYGTNNEWGLPTLVLENDAGMDLETLLKYAEPLLSSCYGTMSAAELAARFAIGRGEAEGAEGTLYTLQESFEDVYYEVTVDPLEHSSRVTIRFGKSYRFPAVEESVGFDRYTIGDRITLGSYEQDNNPLNGAEPIRWRILELEGDKALIISEQALDCRPFNLVHTGVAWEDCTLRQWLNGEFYDMAFASHEKGKILTSEVEQDWNYLYYQQISRSTSDRVFLLSATEVARYFDSERDRICYPTEYAIARGVMTYYEGKCWWWTRTSDYLLNDAYCVYSKGGIDVNQTGVHDVGGGIRPALWVDLSH